MTQAKKSNNAIANVAAFIDQYHPQKDGRCSVSIRVTYKGNRRYYPTGISLKPLAFRKIMKAFRLDESEKDINYKITAFQSKATDIVKNLKAFTFSIFEEKYLDNRDATDSLSSAFDKYVKRLEKEDRIGTAVSYKVAKKSLEAFKKDLKFADVTTDLLKEYESWMLKNGKSITTVGIYLRSLRTIMNRAAIDRSLYPFGESENKYSIPSGRNIKKALNIQEIASIFHYEAEKGSTEEMARDYWVFIYLCNGLNVKDLCLLKRKNLDGNIINYERAKTKRSKKEKSEIVISLKPQAKDIIKKWGQSSIDPQAYVFPHLTKGMSAEVERKTIQQVTKTINKYMKRVAQKLSINKEVTTYYARHSFATILKNSGASIEFISEALGHNDSKTTKSYLSGFLTDTIHSTTDALTAFSK